MTFEIVDTVTGVVIGALVWRAGYAYGARRERTKIPPPPEAVCQCTHNYSVHDADGTCRASVKVKIKEGEPILSPDGSYVVAHRGAEYERRGCACQRYTGPEPLPEYIP